MDVSRQVMGSAQGYAFQQWLRGQVRAAPGAPDFPGSKEGIAAHRLAVRALLEAAAGPAPACEPLAAEIHQHHVRRGYRVEAVSFPTLAGLRMTATAYVPDAGAPVPGVLAVHGHARHGRRDQRMQMRCIAMARSGYFVLAVDAFGNGERSIKLPGMYHGGLDAAALWLTGHSLFGIQVHENRRACDYLVSRPEVDADRLGISGASGGGNQTFYSGVWDERFQAVVPVCSIGSYHKLVGGRNCMCETPFGLAGALEQYDLFACIAPRALLILSARADSNSFRHENARETLERARVAWALQGGSDKAAFEALPIRHGYPPVALERCLRWFDRWLKASGEPVAPEGIATAPGDVEDYEALACYRRAVTCQVMTMPAFFSTARETLRRKQTRPTIDKLRRVLAAPDPGPLEVEPVNALGYGVLPGTTGLSRVIRGRDGSVMTAHCYWPDAAATAERTLLWIGDAKERAAEADSTWFPGTPVQHALTAGFSVWAVDLPGLGEGRLPEERTDGITASRACHLLGFSLAGYWLALLQALADAARRESSEVWLYASGGPATAALAGAALLEAFDRLILHGPVASYLRDERFENIPFEALIPGLLTVGDIPETAALAAPRPLTVVAPQSGQGMLLPAAEAARILDPVFRAYDAKGGGFHLLDAEEALSTTPLALCPMGGDQAAPSCR